MTRELLGTLCGALALTLFTVTTHLLFHKRGFRQGHKTGFKCGWHDGYTLGRKDADNWWIRVEGATNAEREKLWRAELQKGNEWP